MNIIIRGVQPLLLQVRTHSNFTVGRVKQCSENTTMTIEAKAFRKYFLILEAYVNNFNAFFKCAG